MRHSTLYRVAATLKTAEVSADNPGIAGTPPPSIATRAAR